MASLIYKNLFFYRAVMNFLYTGSYKKRFARIFTFIEEKSLLELCFADTIIASGCKNRRISWIGIDINKKFVHCANKKGFDARQADLNNLSEFPHADICLMIGSLYHFHENAELIIKKMLQAAPRVIICEPIINLSESKGFIGKLARFSSSTSAGYAGFRYNKESLFFLLNKLSEEIVFNYRIADVFKKDITLILYR